MVIKPSIQFLNYDSDSQIIINTNTIITDMTGNVSYAASIPTMPVVKAALDDFSTALANAADGGITLTSIKNDKRAVLVGLLRELASYVQVACKGDLTVLLSSGFPIQKPTRSPIGFLTAPTGLTVVPGSLTGQLDASATPVTGAAIYNWQLAAASAPTVIVQTAQTTGAGNSFTGLTPGIRYLTQINAVGAAGPSNWSDPVSQIAL
jgi:hypothetical protein